MKIVGNKKNTTVEIIQNGNPVLRKVATEVKVSDITKPKVQKILKEMKEALHSQDDGVAIAAPQIGVSLRIFIVNGRIFDDDFSQEKDSIRGDLFKKIYSPDLIFINPFLKKISKDKKLLDEGCLSVRPTYGKVRRATKATVEAYDENGNKFTKEGNGLLAHIFQHENDHLDGVLFIDKAKNLREVPLEQSF